MIYSNGYFPSSIQFFTLNLIYLLFNVTHKFQVSFDDVCYMDCVITRVALSEVEPEKFAISKAHIKQTKKLLKEALAAEQGEEDVGEDEGTNIISHPPKSPPTHPLTHLPTHQPAHHGRPEKRHVLGESSIGLES